MKRLLYGIAALAVAVPVTVFGLLAADAAPPRVLSCNLTGSTIHQQVGLTPTWNWTLTTRGTCVDGSATYWADMPISGTSTGLGLCTASLVTNLSLSGNLTLVSNSDGSVESIPLSLGAPVTTYPATTPVLVSRAGAQVGAGTIFNHIFAKCPPEGDPATNIYLEILR